MTSDTSSALVIFSGGQDSATCLGWALNRFDNVSTVGFDYGQRHHVEMACRQNMLNAVRTDASLPASWPAKLGEDTLLSLGLFNQIGETAMTSDMEIAFNEQGIPNTFVPGRNLVFLTAAAALAWRKGVRHLVMGVCETDFSGYPDCRDDTIKAMQVALNLGMDSRFVVHTPLMWLDKADTWDLAEREGGAPFVEAVRTVTHTCYLGDRADLHPWGYGCGECPACKLRARGWEEYASRRGASGGMGATAPLTPVRGK